MLTAEQKLEKILEHLKLGRTIVISTYSKAGQVDQKSVDRFSKAGLPLFKVEGNSLFMARGKSYDCIDYCQFKIYE